MVGLPMDEHLK